MEKISMFLLALFLVVGCSNNTNEDFENAMAKGREAVISEEYEKALAYFELALEEKSDDAEAKVFVAQTEKIIEALELQEEEEYDNALALFEEAETMDGGYDRLSEQAKEQREALVAQMDEQAEQQVADEAMAGDTATESTGESAQQTEEQDFREKFSGTFVDASGKINLELYISSDNVLEGTYSYVDNTIAPITFTTPVTYQGTPMIYEIYQNGSLADAALQLDFEETKFTLIVYLTGGQTSYEFNL